MPSVTEARGGRRPNFILFVTDQQRADHLGCYGHPVLRTSAIDGLARRGVRYDACYVASPVCMPNRASLMTGRMPSVHGVRMNGIPLSTDQVTFVELLRDAGYRTALVGKSHLQNFTGHPPYEAEPPVRSGFHRADGVLAPAPGFGEHNAEILGGLLGLSEDEQLALEAAGVTAAQPEGVPPASEMPATPSML